jgi:hypothetical protein
MNIVIKAICSNKKCKKAISITEDNEFYDVVEITIDCGEQTLSYVCPYCNNENKILLGKLNQVKYPGIGGVR